VATESNRNWLLVKDINQRTDVGTFHSICRRYLVKYGSMIGLSRGWGIADTDDSSDPFWYKVDDRVAILKQILKEMRSSIEPNNARSIISSLKSNGVSAEQYHANNTSNYSSQQRTGRSEISFEMAQIYQ
jgi:DNA helicase II / ATP-dependent DNA helicase PcrA